MATAEFTTNQRELLGRLDSSYARLKTALAKLQPEQAFEGTEWSVADCLNHLAPRDGGYGNYVTTLIKQEQARARTSSPIDRRWGNMQEGLASEYQKCKEILFQITTEQWEKPVAQADGSTRPLSHYFKAMVSHFEEHGNQVVDQIIPRVARKG